MKINHRGEWRAARAARPFAAVPMSMRTELIIHHSAGPADQSIRAIQQHHIANRGFADIGYNFLIRGTTGEVFEGRGWNGVGAHTAGRNTEGLGVCVIGTDLLELPAKRSLRELYRLAVDHAGHPLQIRGHRDHAATECPGDRIYGWITSGAMEKPVLPVLPVLRLTSPFMLGRAVRTVQRVLGVDVDGIYGPITALAVREWQSAHGLKRDGIVGPRTWAAMGITELD